MDFPDYEIKITVRRGKGKRKRELDLYERWGKHLLDEGPVDVSEAVSAVLGCEVIAQLQVSRLSLFFYKQSLKSTAALNEEKERRRIQELEQAGGTYNDGQPEDG